MSYLCGWCSNNEIRAVPKSIYSLSSHNHDSSYLKLTGGTITSPDEHGFTIKRDHASYGPYIKFMNQSGVMGWIGFSAINNAVVMNNDWTGFYKIWHEGNFNPSNYSTTTHNHDSSYLTITTDQTVSGKKTYNVGKLAFGGNESNEIVNTHFANGAISTDGSSAFNGYNSIKNALEKYKEANQIPVEIDYDEIQDMGIKVVPRRLIEESTGNLVRHSAQRVARAIHYWYRKSMKK